jgi:hypothetical protein
VTDKIKIALKNENPLKNTKKALNNTKIAQKNPQT